jgi:uncharacterized protein YbjT (DUF2867 family)
MVSTFVIAGVTGRVGSVVASEILSQGHQVRGISREAARAERWRANGGEAAVGSLADANFLRNALRGAQGFFVLLPEDPFAADFHGSRRAMAEAIATAIRESGVPHVVVLSAIAACVADGNGPAKDLHYLEGLVRASAPKSTIVRACWFQENVGSIVPAARQGIFPSLMASADAPFPTIATRDVGHIVASLLLSPPPSSEVIDLMGPAYSPRDLAAALGSAVGTTLTVVEVPASAHVGALMQAGLPQSFAEDVAELYACFNAGRAQPHGGRVLAGSTSLAEVLPTVLGS